MTPRAVLVFPGRGSYGASELGTLARTAASSELARDAVTEVAAAIDAPRRARGLPSVLELDAMPRFDPAVHLRGEHASALIVACGAVDARLVARGGALEVVGAIGNSLGFYTALEAAGALALDDLARLVDTITALQAERGRGGQVIFPLVDDQWRPDRSRSDALARALAESRAFRSVELGAFDVLAGDDDALAALEARLPRAPYGGRDYPLRLHGHHAFHTELLVPVAAGARERLADLGWRAPRVHVVLGTGAIATPWSCDPRELAGYTLGEQITTTFRLATALRVGLRELAPDVVVLAGPGESIGGVIGAAIVRDAWRGIASKEAFVARQREQPLLLALGRPDQRVSAKV